ncbi:MAG: Hint domain-containing protein [Rhodobacteraceae bacterium]|nr:Hint domain-containing protein [Paracoccaceae bacterium]
MGYNISEVSGATGGVSDWEFTLDLSAGTTTISGDFDVVPLLGGGGASEATDGYVFSALDRPDLGTLSWNGTTGQFTFTVNTAAVAATGSDQQVSFGVVGTSGANSDDDTVTINILICVARGTLIEGACGPVAVEALSVGDLVQTLDGPPVPIRWIGRRRLGPETLHSTPSLRPIRICRGALGGGLPWRDLRVSPQHRVLLRDWRAELLFGEAEVLVPAKCLVNDKTIVVEPAVEQVEYFHLLFDQHELIFTEGAPTESFHPGPFALRELDEPARAELVTLFPELDRGVTLWPAARPALKPWEGKMLEHAFAPQETARAS